MISKIKLVATATAAFIGFATQASAVLVLSDTVTLIDASKEAVYFTETATTGGGTYSIHNNVANSNLMAFGISNTGSTAFVDGTPGDTFGCEFGASGPGSNWCYGASNLNASNWAQTSLYYDFDTGNDVTGFDAFGDFANVVDAGEDTLNFYTAVDGDILGGQSSTGWFGFSDSVPASQLMIVLGTPTGIVTGSGGTPFVASPPTGPSPVPLPAAAWLLMAGLAGMGFAGRRRST